MMLSDIVFLLLLAVKWCYSSCPDARLVHPCQCQSENNVVSMACSNLLSVDQLRKIFESSFPQNELRQLVVKHSQLGNIGANIFADKSFSIILFQNVSGIEEIEQHAFAASVDRLRVFSIDSSPLKNLAVPGISSLVNLIDFEVTSSVDNLTEIPSLPNLQYLHLYGNRFASPPYVPYMPKLHSLWLNSGRLTAVQPFDWANLPALKKAVFFGNRIHRLNEDDLHFHSPFLQLVDLSDNQLSDIKPNSIQGISFNTVLDLRKNALRQLDENVFRPLIGKLIRGSGFIQLSGNHIECSSAGWIIKEPKLLTKISNNTICSE